MGLGGISIWQLLIILVIVVLLFGTKRLRHFGSDMGSAIKSFRSAAREDDNDLTAERLDREEDGKDDADFDREQQQKERKDS